MVISRLIARVRGSVIEASRGEAQSLLSKWLEERTKLECRITFSRSFWARLRGRVVELSAESFSLASEGAEELKVKFESCAAFAFGDTTAVSSSRGRFEDTVVFVLRFDDAGLNDFISLSQIVPEGNE